MTLMQRYAAYERYLLRMLYFSDTLTIYEFRVRV